jgi:hypothetical protein
MRGGSPMNNKDKYDDIFDHMLQYAAEQSMEDMANDYPLDSELDQQPSYSPEFESRMTNYFKKVKRRGQTYRLGRVALKVAVFALVFLGVSTAVVFNVEAFRVPFLNLFSQSGDISITINVRDEKADYSSFRDKVSGMDLPTYIPENYYVESIEATKTLNYVVYANVDGDKIILDKLFEGTVVMDNEHSMIKDITVNDEPAQFFEKSGMRTLIFKFNGNYFMLNGIISEDELFQIAQSMAHYK